MVRSAGRRSGRFPGGHFDDFDSALLDQILRRRSEDRAVRYAQFTRVGEVVRGDHGSHLVMIASRELLGRRPPQKAAAARNGCPTVIMNEWRPSHPHPLSILRSSTCFRTTPACPSCWRAARACYVYDTAGQTLPGPDRRHRRQRSGPRRIRA